VPKWILAGRTGETGEIRGKTSNYLLSGCVYQLQHLGENGNESKSLQSLCSLGKTNQKLLFLLFSMIKSKSNCDFQVQDLPSAEEVWRILPPAKTIL